jgi:hypothetical protein
MMEIIVWYNIIPTLRIAGTSICTDPHTSPCAEGLPGESLLCYVREAVRYKSSIVTRSQT